MYRTRGGFRKGSLRQASNADGGNMQPASIKVSLNAVTRSGWPSAAFENLDVDDGFSFERLSP